MLKYSVEQCVFETVSVLKIVFFLIYIKESNCFYIIIYYASKWEILKTIGLKIEQDSCKVESCKGSGNYIQLRSEQRFGSGRLRAKLFGCESRMYIFYHCSRFLTKFFFCSWIIKIYFLLHFLPKLLIWYGSLYSMCN